MIVSNLIKENWNKIELECKIENNCILISLSDLIILKILYKEKKNLYYFLNFFLINLFFIELKNKFYGFDFYENRNKNEYINNIIKGRKTHITNNVIRQYNEFMPTIKKLDKFLIKYIINNNIKPNNISHIYLKPCYLITRFKKKNLYLTLLSARGDVLCKTNIGRFGFKKKVKATGHAIKGTGKKFGRDIVWAFLKTVYFRRKFCRLKWEKINNLIFIQRKRFYSKLLFNCEDIIYNLKKYNKNKFIHKPNFLKLLPFIKKKQQKTKIKNNKITKYLIIKYISYRKHFLSNYFLKNSFKLIIRSKTALKYWGFNFLRYGIIKYFKLFSGIELRLPIPFSLGSIRIKKKRRV